jgi:dephospho-CoA kinase
MLLLGLTGSIATGKSTVSRLLSSAPYNLPIIDADLLARQVVEPGTPGYEAIVTAFGDSTPDLLLPPSDAACGGQQDGKDGKGRPLNRPALGRRVFGGTEEAVRARKKLNGIVHPAVRREMYKAILRAYGRGWWAVVLDVPLLFESGWEPFCGTIVVVGVSDPEIQMRRLRERDAHLTEEDARNRVLSQVDIREKAERCLRRGKRAGKVVWNDAGLKELEMEVRRVMDEVRRESPRWWCGLLWVCPPLAGAAAVWSFVRSWWIMKAWEREKKRERARL